MSANPRQDGCQSGACKRSADQANDVLSYMATLGSGFRGASAAELGGDVWVPPEWSRGGSAVPGGKGRPVSKAKGCQKQGPGCASRACNECADMAVEVLDYMSTLGDGIVRATPESVLASRMSGGFVPGGHAFGGSRYRETAKPRSRPRRRSSFEIDGLYFGGYVVCYNCDDDWDAQCAEKFGDALANPDADASENQWASDGSSCSATLSCLDSTPLCDPECIGWTDEAMRGECTAKTINGSEYQSHWNPTVSAHYDAVRGTCVGVIDCGYGGFTVPVEAWPCYGAVAQVQVTEADSCEGVWITFVDWGVPEPNHNENQTIPDGLTDPDIAVGATVPNTPGWRRCNEICGNFAEMSTAQWARFCRNTFLRYQNARHLYAACVALDADFNYTVCTNLCAARFCT